MNIFTKPVVRSGEDGMREKQEKELDRIFYEHNKKWSWVGTFLLPLIFIMVMTMVYLAFKGVK